MAKTIGRVRVILNSSETTFDNTSNTVDYRVSEGDLSKRASLSISDIDTNQTVSGFWDAVIDAIETAEGI